MNEETLKVLEMVKEGKITVEEGEKLLAAMRQSDTNSESNEPLRNKTKYSMLRIRIVAKEQGQADNAKVTLNVPLTLAKKAAGLLALVPKDTKKDLNEKGIDLDSINIKELIELFELGEINEELVNIVTGDEEKGATVRIYVD